MYNPQPTDLGRKGAQYLRYQLPAVTVDIFPHSPERLDAAMTLDENGVQFVWRG
jgi:hypothetical protein